jgi:magnesium transporter
MPPLASFLDDSASPGRVAKASNEPRLRCTEFDEHGNVTLVNGEFKKSELIAKVSADRGNRISSCALVC